MPLQPAATFLAINLERGMFDIGSKVFLSAHGRKLFYTELPSLNTQRTDGADASVILPLFMREVPISQAMGLGWQSSSSVFGFKYDESSELLALLLHDCIGNQGAEMRLLLLHFPSGAPHPNAIQHSYDLVANDYAATFPTQVSVYGDHVGVVVPGWVYIFNWKNGVHIKLHRPLREYQSISFLSESVIALPNTFNMSIELWACFPSSENPMDRFFRYISELALPDVMTYWPQLHLISWLKCTTLPSSSGDEKTRHLTFEVCVDTETGECGRRDVRVKWIANVDGLLETLKHRLLTVRSSEPFPTFKDRVPWRLWGPPITSCFDATEDVEGLDNSVRYYHSLKKIEDQKPGEATKYSLQVYSFPVQPARRHHRRFLGLENNPPVFANEFYTSLPRRLLLDVEVPYWCVLMDDYQRMFCVRETQPQSIGDQQFISVEVMTLQSAIASANKESETNSES